MDMPKDALDRHCALMTFVGERASPLMREGYNNAIYPCRGLDYDITTEWQHFRPID